MITTHIPNKKHPWLTVEIETVGDSKHVTICSRIHLNKRTRLANSWGLSFSDEAILADSDFLKHLNRFY